MTKQFDYRIFEEEINYYVRLPFVVMYRTTGGGCMMYNTYTLSTELEFPAGEWKIHKRFPDLKSALEEKYQLEQLDG